MEILKLSLAKNDISNAIDGTVLYYYGEKKWNNMSLKQRKNIIEDIVRDKSSYYNLAEPEIRDIIKYQQDQEG